MRFDQALQAPVHIEWGSLRIGIPKFTLDDFAAWAAEEQCQREDRLTRGLKTEEKFHYLAFYNIMPLDASELRRLVRTPQGVRKVVGTCLCRAKIIGRENGPVDEPLPEDVKKQILDAPVRDQERLAVLLADVDDYQKLGNQQASADAESSDDATLATEAKPDPLPSTATAASSG